jgi:hypothetical protein
MHKDCSGVSNHANVANQSTKQDFSFLHSLDSAAGLPLGLG